MTYYFYTAGRKAYIEVILVSNIFSAMKCSTTKQMFSQEHTQGLLSWQGLNLKHPVAQKWATDKNLGEGAACRYRLSIDSLILSKPYH